MALVLALSLLAAACAASSSLEIPSGDSAKIRAGLLMLGLDMDSFFEVWGPPDRTLSALSEEQLQARWGFGGGGFFKGKQTLNVWVYAKRGVELVFDDDDELVAWRTDKTVEQLRSVTKP